MIAFGGPDAVFRCPEPIDRYLALRFNDIVEPRDGLQEPTREHTEQIIQFIDHWDQSSPVLFQCWMGVSRSTAAAAITLAALLPDMAPNDIASRLRAASSTATPNPLMVRWADDILGWGGRFSKAIAGIGRGATAAESVPFSIEL